MIVSSSSTSPLLINTSLTTNQPSSDRTLGLIIAISGGIVFYIFRNWIRKQNKKETIPDDIHSIRYTILEKLIHCGSCHCQRVRFRIRAPRILNTFDIQSKVRFPRLIIKCEDFENMSDENNLSLYAVTNGQNIGIHAFCSYCGVHVLFSPVEEPKEIQINVECLDQTNIEKINVSYCGISDSIACDLTDARTRLYSFTQHQLNPSTPTVDVVPILPSPPPQLPLQQPLPASLSRSASRGGIILPSHYNNDNRDNELIDNNDISSETISELLVDGIENIDEKQFSRDILSNRQQIEIRDIHHHIPLQQQQQQQQYHHYLPPSVSSPPLSSSLSYNINHPFPINQINTTRGSNNGYFSSSNWSGEHNIRPNSDLGYSRDWDQDIVLHRSRKNISLRDSVNSSNSLSNSYTTSDSNSVVGISQERSIESNYSNWNSNTSSSLTSSETPTAALHRRLRTFLHRHLPQNKTNTLVSNLSPSFDSRVDGYDSYEGRWRR